MAEVVVLHVLVDILLKIFGAIGLFPLCELESSGLKEIPIRSTECENIFLLPC